MISDTLFDAREEIQRYLNDDILGACYKDPSIRAEIEKCLAEMERMQKLLDLGSDDTVTQ
jgi:hypothetical protein